MPAERIALSTLLGPENGALLRDVAERISAGAVFVYPTETIYGIGGMVDGPNVYCRIIAAKRRPPDQPMILIAARRTSFSRHSIVFPAAAERLAAAFWPGPLTLILPSPESPDGRAIRVSDHPFLTALSPYCDIPLYSTSANRSGDSYCADPEMIYAGFENSVDFMIDAGVLPPSKPSTVVKVSENGTVAVIREGCIATESIDSAVA